MEWVNLPVGGCGASGKSLDAELGSSVVANLLSRLVTVGGQGLISGSGGVEAVGVRVGSCLSVAGCHCECDGRVVVLRFGKVV